MVRLSATQNQLMDKIKEGPQPHELLYAQQHEQLHYAKRNQVKTLNAQMTESAKDHRLKQDELLRRNANFRNQLLQLRRQLVEAQRL